MKKADLVLKNGKILSVTLDGKRTTGTAVAVKDGRILKAGSDEEIVGYIGDRTEVIDCGGNTIMPGMCDAHCHPSLSASLYIGCNLFGIYIKEGQMPQEITNQYMTRLNDYVKKHKDDSIIRGIGWVKGNYSEDKMPTRHDIDRICSDKPVILESFCQHNLWVNTKALEIAGIDADYPDPVAGTIYREADGYPSGVLAEPEAMEPVKSKVPGYDFTVEKYKEGFDVFQKTEAGKYGVTMIQDCMYTENGKQAYKELAEEEKLNLRVRGVYMVSPANYEDDLDSYIKIKGSDNVGEDFRVDTIKIFDEGTLFALNEPYEKEYIDECGFADEFKGNTYWQDEALMDTVEKAVRAGFDVHVHAMGDASVKQSARCLAEGQRRAGSKRRNVIAHLMLVDDEDAKIMGEAGIMGNCQPRWMVYDSDIAGMIPMMGEKRAASAYPYRKLLDNGVRVAFGTDFPVTPPPDTFHEIQCAMTRSVFPDAPDYESFKGKVLGEEKAATLLEAVQSITINGAYQMNMDDITGSIEEGKSAELVILNADLEKTPVEEIYGVKVLKTIFKGMVVFEQN